MNFMKKLVMNKTVAVYKPLGMTPGELVKAYKDENPEYANETISYAGRLDPLAHGVMVLLIGEANKQRRDYEKSDKVYEFKAILGFATDSYDICGIITGTGNTQMIELQKISETLKGFEGKSIQPFPLFSSYKIKGKALFAWARENRLNEIEVPSKEIEVYETKVLGTESIMGVDLLQEIESRISLLKGDFRQEEIVAKWRATIKQPSQYQVVNMKAKVSAGTYIRGIVNELGDKLGTKATVLEIYRPQSGEYTVK